MAEIKSPISNLGRVYVNNDTANLYLGLEQVMTYAGNNVFLFLESPRLTGVSSMRGVGNGVSDPTGEGADGLDCIENLSLGGMRSLRGTQACAHEMPCDKQNMKTTMNNSHGSPKLRYLAGFTLLAAMLPLTSSHAQSGTAGGAAGAGVPAAIREQQARGAAQLRGAATGADITAAVQADIAKLQSSNPRERSDAIMKLRRSDAAAAIPALIQMLGSQAEFPRMVLHLSSHSPITHSCSSEYTFGGEAAETLARIGKMSDDLLACLKSADWRTRANAVRALGGLKDRRAAEELIAILERNDESWEVKGNAALALGLFREERAAQPLLTALKDQNARVRGAAATALGAIQAPGGLQALIAALKDRDPEVRRNAAVSVGRMGGAAAVEPLVQMLEDEDRTVREVVARALGWPKDPRAVSALIAALEDPYVNVQINAAEALGQIKSPAAMDPLLGLLTHDEEAVRGAAANALGELGDARAREALVAMVRREARESAILRGLQALAKLGHSGAASALQVYGLHRPNWKEWWRQNKEPLLNR